jgi:hypothetical protein
MTLFRSCARGALLMGILLLPGLAAAGDLFVIGHSDVNLSASEIKEVYLGDKQLAGSVKLVPVDNAAAQAQFLEKAIKMDPGKYSSFWTKKTFRDGINPPAVKGSDSEVLSFVKATAGAIGYVSTAPGADVKTLAKF